MWIAFSDAFVSVVADRNDTARLVVRARNPEHLERLFPAHEIVLTPKADYIARVVVTREEFTRVLVERVDEMEYDNFKASVEDERLYNLYEQFWSIHRAYQQVLSVPDRTHHFSWGPNDVVLHKRKD